jgi:hypothetical protein
MRYFNTLSIALILGLFLVGTPALAQTPVPGGRLLVAQPGTVTLSYVGQISQLSVDWQMIFGWSTGPGPLDFVRFNVEGGLPHTSGSGAVGPPAYAHTSGTPHNLGAQWIAEIPAGTLVFAETLLFNSRIGDANATIHQLHTGLDNKQIAFSSLNSSSASGAVAALSGGGAIVGFPLLPTSSPFNSILDYPIRILISNVCVR